MKFNTFFSIIIGLCIGLVLKLFIIDVVKVSGDSMEPTILSNSTVVINKLAYGIVTPLGADLLLQWASPQKGDIVVYLYNNKMVVKRCAGIAGEVLDFSDDSQYIIVEDISFPLSEKQYQRIKFDEVVPDKTIFAIGDNYMHSVDSRDYGFIPTKNILGKVIQ